MKNQEKKDSLLKAFKSNALKLESLAKIKGGNTFRTYRKSGTSGNSATIGDYVGLDSEVRVNGELIKLDVPTN